MLRLLLALVLGFSIAGCALAPPNKDVECNDADCKRLEEIWM
jgi:hypothetical protein